MTYDNHRHQTLLAYPEIRDRLILLDGWSKTYAMTGWRLGFSIWPKALYDNARKLAVNSYSCVNSAAQFAGLAALTGPQDAVARDGRRIRRPPPHRRRRAQPIARRALRRRRRARSTPFPNIAATGWKAKPLADALLEEAGVATIGGPDFGVYGEGYLRLSYANSREDIQRALERIDNFLHGRPPPPERCADRERGRRTRFDVFRRPSFRVRLVG